MAQAILAKLAAAFDMLENGLLELETYDPACEDLLGQLLSSTDVSLSDKQEALKAAKQYDVSPSLMLKLGKQLLQMTFEHNEADAGTTTSEPQQHDQETQQQQQQQVPSPCPAPLTMQQRQQLQQQRAQQVSSQQHHHHNQQQQAGLHAAGQLDSSAMMLGLPDDHQSEDGTPTSDDTSDDEVDMFGPAFADRCAAEYEEDYQELFEEQHRTWIRSGYGDQDIDWELDAPAACGLSLDHRDIAHNVEAAEALGLAYDADQGEFQELPSDLNPQAAPSAAAAAGAGPSAAAAAAADPDLQSDLDTDDADDEVIRAADRKALKEIKHHQHCAHRLLSTVAFADLANEVLQRHVKEAGYSFDPVALVALQHAVEDYLVHNLELGNMCATHAGRKKLTVADMQMARDLAKRFRMEKLPTE